MQHHAITFFPHRVWTRLLDYASAVAARDEIRFVRARVGGIVGDDEFVAVVERDGVNADEDLGSAGFGEGREGLEVEVARGPDLPGLVRHSYGYCS